MDFWPLGAPQLFILPAFLAFYFLPTIIVLARGRNDGCGIFAVNLLFGLTVIGWVVALVWSLTGSGRNGRSR